jgi:adenylosuccinate synthase
MPVASVIGILWGDEGKGKVIDYLASDADYVVRYGGGHNAGHTILIGDQRTVLHLVPSGILHAGTINVIGNGVVVDPSHLLGEVEGLLRRGVEVVLGQNLLLSERAHLILPLHQALDHVAEQVRGEGKIGTTGRGIGPTYADRAARCGLRAGDLLRPERLEVGLDRLLAEKNPILAAFGQKPIEPQPLLQDLLAHGRRLAPAITDTGRVLRAALAARKRILCEGAQGVLLDVDHGTYPFVTSSNASTGGIASGTGLPPAALDDVLGVVKAYATRVGTGPFPSELTDETGNRLRESGREYGSTTGRPRRCGWFDAVAVRYAAQVSGTQSLIVTNLDVLTGFDPLRITVAYDLDGRRVADFPAFDLERCRPIYEAMPGFTGDLGRVRRFGDLPEAARHYVEAIERLTATPVRTISVGPARDQVIQR